MATIPPTFLHGDPSPSREDEKATMMLAAACRAVGIPLIDHVVVGDAALSPPGYYSFRISRPDLFAAE